MAEGYPDRVQPAIPVASGTIELETPSGPARAHVSGAAGRGLVVLGHGAGGGVEAGDLVAVTRGLVEAGWVVARVEQPYRVRGRRAPDRAPVLDAAWLAVVAALRRRQPGPLVTGGRSSGARVACRTAAEAGAAAVVCLAFPLHPPGRPEASRAAELAQVPCPVLVVQGERDAFGGPDELPPGPVVVRVPGDHSLRRTSEVAAAVNEWLEAQRVA
jgi:predicted alpha/beta-hydrolase family hydrolase